MPDTWPQKLVGTWTLVSWEQKKGDGSNVRRYGENPVGIAFFDAGGRYIISVMRSDRVKYTSAILEHAGCYFARFHTNSRVTPAGVRGFMNLISSGGMKVMIRL
jgi:hypothetical protein